MSEWIRLDAGTSSRALPHYEAAFDRRVTLQRLAIHWRQHHAQEENLIFIETL